MRQVPWARTLGNDQPFAPYGLRTSRQRTLCAFEAARPTDGFERNEIRLAQIVRDMPFRADISDSRVNRATAFRAKLRQTSLASSDLDQASFAETDVRAAVFERTVETGQNIATFAINDSEPVAENLSRCDGLGRGLRWRPRPSGNLVPGVGASPAGSAGTVSVRGADRRGPG
ncbi:hypothetical protein ACQPW1_22215 [Nocardia sp. CA-128927]|uniref:hypothetical protein n=1 Tax=Nocardia sp. CA-128927 TaxID=3239975 RepID=UPI003D99D8F4